MNENRLPDYLDHLWEAARQACSYVEGMDEEAFLIWLSSGNGFTRHWWMSARGHPGGVPNRSAWSGFGTAGLRPPDSARRNPS